MTTLQFSLFLAGLLVCYLLVHLRLLKFEKHLVQLDQLDTMRRAMLQVAKQTKDAQPTDGPAPAPPADDRIVELLAAVQGSIGGLGDTATEIVRRLAALADQLERDAEQRSAPPVVLPTPESTPADRLRATVETRLLGLGYGRVRILTDLADELPVDRERELTVECEREGLPFKGRVVTRNGAVLDVHMQNAVQAFP